MANQNDSFIDEVTDELRRDRLYAGFRRYGWIGILVILLVVGGAAWREYTIAQETAKAQEFGDAVLAAAGDADAASALATLADSSADAGRAAVAGLLAAGAQAEAGASAEASRRLEAVADGLGDQDAVVRDLARFKRVLAEGAAMDPAERDAVLAELARPGAPFELLALEQQAIALVGAGRAEDAATLIAQIQQKDGVSESLRRRLSEMMIALGEEVPRPARPAAVAGADPVQMPPAPAN